LNHDKRLEEAQILGLRDRFRRKPVEVVDKRTDLEKFLGDDKETYEALIDAMFLDPRKIGMTIKEAVENAKKYEKEDDPIRARVMYEVAGALAIYEGNSKKVVEYFSECERLDPNTKYPIIKNPEKAVDKAQEYYKRYLK
jgi:hypothetical protein